ncbi:AAA family ATPase [Aerococcus sanguinicola]|uniref:AAA family ATPase n=1 Tax=Aerococcus sanguinicola TaxID=119206 RepID=A0A5N1GML3_9LACT|nr:AAA family ATPase [Aerococcus sanguinicola]KAA9302207.1 AAA family ATPase [Aerococcus sanguinicola]
MLIDTIHIKGFRCFKDAIIHFTDKNLILGANDIGKSNLIYALRLLFDKSLSYRDLELTSNDYYAYEETNEIMITVKVSNISEDCLVAGFKENIQNGTTYIRYSNRKDGIHVISTGPTIDTLEEATSRFYLRFLNMEVVNSSRNLKQFIKREKII